MLSPKSFRGRAAVFGVLLPALLLAPRGAAAQAQGVRGEASVTTTGGYGRLVIRTSAEIESQVRMTSGILVIQFRQPVNIAVDRLGAAAGEYIGAARRDPDGRALRFALTQKVKLSSMTAGDRLFVDLLPESFTGEPPGLPREVVEELARRANEAERVARQQKLALEMQRTIPAVRVRVTGQPTFTRYIFELPELTGVTAERGKDKLTLTFARPLRFELSDAKLASAKAVAAVDAGGSGDTSEVQFRFSQASEVRTFREDSNNVVDVSPIDAISPAAANPFDKSSLLAGIAAPQTVPAQASPEPKMAGVAPPTAPIAMARSAAGEAEPPAPVRPPLRDPNRPVTAELRRQGDNLRLLFPFAAPTPAAVFQRADTLWLVFDTKAALDVAVLGNDQSKTIRSATVAREDDA
ncbi:MAG: hypothetical protein QOF09_2125, partial [Alphaproteobacteria bacterium]|nr:hypothetical protein [Alphaproteobacteria bacterium]